MERKWTERYYYVQDNADVVNQDVKIYCNTNQFPSLPSYGPCYKPHGEIGLIKNYHFRFDPKIGNVICTVRRIPCACVACTSMLDKHWISFIPSY